ncbi:MAG: hypothetical protein IKK73_01815 [Akkermansia sp.]|nr:hypothetical protein [Akkermansia sp.]
MNIPCSIDPLGTRNMIPSVFTHVEAFECNGQQKIELRIAFSSNFGFRFVVEDSSQSEVSTLLFAAGTFFPSCYNGALRFKMPSRSYFPIKDGSYTEAWRETVDRDYYVVRGKKIDGAFNWKCSGDYEFSFGNEYVKRIIPENVVGSPVIALFGSDSGAKFFGLFYNMHVTEGSALQASLIPCIDKDGVPCLYDTVRKETLLNIGLSDFIVCLSSQKQLNNMLQRLPDRTGQEVGTLQVRLDAELQTPENLAALEAMVDKNWEISQAA